MAVETRAQVEQKGKCPKPLKVIHQIPNVSQTRTRKGPNFETFMGKG